METVKFTSDHIKDAVDMLQNGEVVAFPTETVYGLGADATDDNAVSKIFKAKNRPADNPLIVHVSSVDMMERYIQNIPDKARLLMEHFWAGPLTMVFNVENGTFAKTVTAGLDTVGIRMPDHPLALELIEQVDVPLAAPSANLSGQPSPTAAEHVYHDLNGKIAGILYGGETGVGLESTVLDMSNPDEPTILRPGGISKEELETLIGTVTLDQSLKDQNLKPKSPGMKYKHYSPQEPVWIVENDWENAIKKLLNNNEKIGILSSDEVLAQWSHQVTATYSLGKSGDAISASRRLYGGLRYFESTEATVILAEAYSKEGIGLAYMNRLEKAAGNKKI